MLTSALHSQQVHQESTAPTGSAFVNKQISDSAVAQSSKNVKKEDVHRYLTRVTRLSVRIDIVIDEYRNSVDTRSPITLFVFQP